MNGEGIGKSSARVVGGALVWGIYVDDIVLVEDSEMELQTMLEVV